jgi:D-lactate dehydrogenase (cytochrome)
MMPSQETLNRLAAVTGEKYAIRNADDMQPYMREWRELWFGHSPMVLRPGSTEEVAKILEICTETRTTVVPQSGNTGLTGGQIPFGEEVLLSLDRMTRIRNVDPVDNTITVPFSGSGQIRSRAIEPCCRRFPLHGGNLSLPAALESSPTATAAIFVGLMVLADGRV